MQTKQELDELAARLSEGQRAYILACGESDAPYEPRHGRAANWAIRHGYAKTLVELGRRVGGWEDFTLAERIDPGIDRILGQRLTERGEALRNHIAGDDR